MMTRLVAALAVALPSTALPAQDVATPIAPSKFVRLLRADDGEPVALQTAIAS